MHTGISPTLAANETVQRLRAEGREILHMGFGQAPFPGPTRVVDALRHSADRHAYLPVAGLLELREAVLAHQARLTGIDPQAWEVIIAPGSKLLLFAVQLSMPGDLLLPVPSWVSYAPQAHLLRQHVIAVPTSLSDHGYRIDAGTLDDVIDTARSAGHHPTKLLINFPNNPTGLTIDDATLAALADVCQRRSIMLISDEIYGRLAFEGGYRSAAAHYPHGTVVTSGLSKHLSLGGWRLGVCLLPRAMPDLIATMTHIASETWSCVSAPVQHAAVEAYAGHADVEGFIARTTAIHAAVNRYVATRLTRMGADCAQPQGGFYTYPDFSHRLGGHIQHSDALANRLLDEHGLVSLPGTAFGEAPERLTLRLSGCDYDGRRALDYLAPLGFDDIGSHLPAIAPAVISAMDALQVFLAKLAPNAGDENLR